MAQTVKTRFLILSDTHGDEFPGDLKPTTPVDVAIHCGDLTQESKLSEFRASIRLLKDLNAPLKLVIAGNHDFTLDIPIFKKKIAEVEPRLETDLVEREYGAFGEARRLFEEASDAGIVFLDEGKHSFTLKNGACLTVYASPYTPSTNDWGFQYSPYDGRCWAIAKGVDVVVTHGPPWGILDHAESRERIGCPTLFEAVAGARPLMHCFGHVHGGWGGRLATWRDPMPESPSHFTAIDNDMSVSIESLAGLRAQKFDTEEMAKEKGEKLRRYKEERCCTTRQCRDDRHPIVPGEQTLFVNAAIQGTEEEPFHLPWLVELDLPSILTKAEDTNS